MERRKFIQSGSLAAASLLLGRAAIAGTFTGKKAVPPVGLQLYTLGDLMTTDPQGTLQKLAAIGYKELRVQVHKKEIFTGSNQRNYPL